MSQSVYRGANVIPTIPKGNPEREKAKMATASKGKTHILSGNSLSNESVYRDVHNPYITYTGTRKKTNPMGPRNVWYIHNEKTHEKIGPFVTLKLAWAWQHNTTIEPDERAQTNLPQYRENGTQSQERQSEPEPEIQNEDQLSLFSEPKEMETADQIIEFTCPHCGKGIIGLLARK